MQSILDLDEIASGAFFFSMAQFIVHGTPASVYVRITLLLLESIPADYEVKEVDIFSGENQTPEYLEMNPFGKVPTLELKGQLLYESTAITDYLDSTVGVSKFTPLEAFVRARMRQIMAIVDNYLYPPAIGTIVIQRLIVPSQGGQSDETAIKNAMAPVQKSLAAIEAIASTDPYLVDSKMTLADMYLIPVVAYLAQTPEFDTLTAQTPKLRAWWERAKTSSIVQKVCG